MLADCSPFPEGKVESNNSLDLPLLSFLCIPRCRMLSEPSTLWQPNEFLFAVTLNQMKELGVKMGPLDIAEER